MCLVVKLIESLKQHRHWLRQKRQAEEDVRFIERIVFFNESVNYTSNTIRIADSDNIETDRFDKQNYL